MLIYLGKGGRRYGIAPVSPTTVRRYWEFQAVVAGVIGMTVPGREARLRSRTLWLSPPGHAHGWTGDGDREARVVVFHYPSVPEPLRRLVRGGEPIKVALVAGTCRRFEELARGAAEYRERPAPGMVMCYEHVLLELSLLIYEAQRGEQGHAGADNDRRVTAALRWYSERLENNPGQAEVARAANVSVSHLRRLFHDVLQAGPKQVFDRLRFQRAVQLMAEPEVKLSEVSAACGFESLSAFSRAFKVKFGCAPDVWRG